MKTQRIRNEAIANTDILAREPAYQDHVLDSLHAGIARALMNIIGDGNEYTVRSIDREEQVDDILSTIFSTTITVGELVRCKDCKYNLNNDRQYDNSDQIMTYVWCNTEAFQENDFCSKGKRRES